MDIVQNSFLRPSLKLDDQKFEFIFLLDHSSSMAGEPIQLAKTALNLILHSLPASSYFNVIIFDHDFDPFFPSSVPYNQANLEQAKASLNAVQARGSTNLLRPLEYVYGRPQIPGYLTQIFSITDGCVENRDAVLRLVASKVKHSRSFSLGIGNGVDRDLVMGIAENAGGSYEFVTSGEPIQPKILYQLKIAQKPALLKPIRVTGSGLILDGHH